jgi:uncharacterized protein
MIVDGLTFVGESIFGYRATTEDLLATMDAAGVDCAVVCPVKPRTYQLPGENERVADAVRQHRGRLVGLGRVDPLLGDEAAAAAETALGELGLSGLFLNPWEETFRASAALVDPIVAVARARGTPVLVATGHPWLSEPLQVADLARRFPDVTFLMTNGGQLNVSGLGQTDAELALARRPNVCVQTAGVYREDFLESVVDRFGAERLVLASSFPLMDMRLELLRVRELHIDEEEKAKVLGGNLRRLFARLRDDRSAPEASSQRLAR